MLAGNGLLSEANLDERTKDVLATPRDANHHEAHREPVAIDLPSLTHPLSYSRNGMSIFVLLWYSGYAGGKVAVRFRSSTVPQ